MAQTQQKTLLQVTPGEEDPLLIGLDRLPTNLPFEECRQQIEHVIETAVSMHDENTVLRWLTMYQTATYNASSYHAQKYGNISYFHAFLKNLFWLLPTDAVSYPSALVEPQFFPTKQYILEHVIEEWNPDFCSASSDVFRFLIAAYGSFKGRVPLPEETELEKKARGRLVSEKTQKMALDIIREWLSKRGFNAYNLEQWIMEPRVPSEILKLLEHAWVRSTNGENVAGHLKRSHVFTSHNTLFENCSKEVRQAIRTWSDELPGVDVGVKRLIENLCASFGTDAEISYVYLPYLSPLKIEITIINNCEEAEKTNYSFACIAVDAVKKSRERFEIINNLLIDLVVKNRDDRDVKSGAYKTSIE